MLSDREATIKTARAMFKETRALLRNRRLEKGVGALLVTSHFEGGPAVAVEALAHGVPVVSTDCSPFLRELLSTEESGRIVPTRDPEALADALLAIRAADAPDPARMAGLIAHLAPGPCADAYLDWFETLAVARGR